MPPHLDYRQKWVDAGYESTMGSAWVRLPPPSDKIAVYHFTSTEYAISDIALSRLKVARFADVNDPFELLSLNFLRGKHLRQATMAFATAHNEQAGMLSFTQNWVNPVLWSHYADNHRGICLGFDLLRNRAQTIHYQSKRLLEELKTANDDPNKLSTDSQQLLICTKSDYWKYEREVRVLVKLEDMIREGALHFCPFDDTLRLKEVILGPRCTASLDAIRKLTDAHHKDAVTVSSRLASGHFSIVPLESTIP